MEKSIAVARGDGIGVEIVDSGIQVLDKVAEIYGHEFIYTDVLVGGAAYDQCNDPLPEETIKICKEADAILFGAVGGSKWDNLPGNKRPERAILGLRKELGLFANIRPAVLYQSLKNASPLKEEIIKDGFDIKVVRELTGGIYFGEKGTSSTDNEKVAYDVEMYSESEVKRIAKIAFEMAMKRRKILTSVDKANVLESSRLWRDVVTKMSSDYPEVELNHMYIDNASMQVIRDPRSFDVIVTSNLFGDILSDEISILTGSIGMLPSASLGKDNIGLYEPIHGSAPDIEGKNIANPIATILSVAMMLDYSFGLQKESKAIEKAVDKVLKQGYRTADIGKENEKIIGTREMTEKILENIQ